MSWVYLLRHFSTASYGIHWRPWKNLSTIASVRSAQAPVKGFTACSKLFTPSIIIILSNPNNTLLWANHSKLPYIFDFPNFWSQSMTPDPTGEFWLLPKNQMASAMCASRQSPKKRRYFPRTSKSFFPRSPANNREAAYEIHHEHATKTNPCPKSFCWTKRPAKIEPCVMYERARMSVCLSVCPYVRTYICMYVHIHTCMNLKFLSCNLTRF